MVAPGDVLIVSFPFAEDETVTFKKRPVLVLADPLGSGEDQAIWVAMITGTARRVLRPGPGDVPIPEWRSAGLDKASVVRTRRVFSAEARHVHRALGAVSPETLATVRGLVVQALRVMPAELPANDEAPPTS